MNKSNKLLSISKLDQFHSQGAGYDILRYHVLPKLLSENTDTVLYFTGRDLARNFEFTTIEDIVSIFEKMGWGKLELIKEKKKEITFHLMSDSTALRINSSLQTDFRLEAGFLAEAIQKIKELPCECTEKVYKRTLHVELSVLFDPKWK